MKTLAKLAEGEWLNMSVSKIEAVLIQFKERYSWDKSLLKQTTPLSTHRECSSNDLNYIKAFVESEEGKVKN